MWTAERKHFKYQIREHKANLKKSWQIIKMVKINVNINDLVQNKNVMRKQSKMEICSRFIFIFIFFCKRWINTRGKYKNGSAGCDELKSNITKNIRFCVEMPLTHICNLSFQKGVSPTELKIANMVPIYKSGDEMIFTNYRPVPILPMFSKLWRDWCIIGL